MLAGWPWGSGGGELGTVAVDVLLVLSSADDSLEEVLSAELGSISCSASPKSKACCSCWRAWQGHFFAIVGSSKIAWRFF